jgi:hypothetical protein
MPAQLKYHVMANNISSTVFLFALLLSTLPLCVLTAPLTEQSQGLSASLTNSASTRQNLNNAVETAVAATTVTDRANGDDAGLRMDLSDFSDGELIKLAQVLQEELDTYDQQHLPIAQEEQVPLMLLPAEFVSDADENREPFPRDRRGQSTGDSELIFQPIPLEDLDSLRMTGSMNGGGQVIVIPDEEVSPADQYVILQENAPSSVANNPEETDNVVLTDSELDDLELRSRIAELSDLLRERAVRDL